MAVIHIFIYNLLIYQLFYSKLNSHIILYLLWVYQRPCLLAIFLLALPQELPRINSNWFTVGVIWKMEQFNPIPSGKVIWNLFQGVSYYLNIMQCVPLWGSWGVWKTVWDFCSPFCIGLRAQYLERKLQ